jgi:hypothetical protein
MTIEVVHRNANDKQTIDELLHLLTQSESILAECQRRLPDTKQYDSLADRIAVMRGKIDKKTMSKNDSLTLESVNLMVSQFQKIVADAGLIDSVSEKKPPFAQE